MSPLPRRSASVIVGPSESPKLHARKLRPDSVNVSCCDTRAMTVSAHFAAARQKSCDAINVSGPFERAMYRIVSPVPTTVVCAYPDAST